MANATPIWNGDTGKLIEQLNRDFAGSDTFFPARKGVEWGAINGRSVFLSERRLQAAMDAARHLEMSEVATRIQKILGQIARWKKKAQATGPAAAEPVATFA